MGAYELERDLEDGLGRNELSLVYQPEFNLGTGRVIGLEALARWMHPTRGLIGPSVFMPIAERLLVQSPGAWGTRPRDDRARRGSRADRALVSGVRTRTYRRCLHPDRGSDRRFPRSAPAGL